MLNFSVFHIPYPTHSHLHDCIKAPLRRVQVPRDVLLAHQGVELLAITGQVQDIFVAEWTGTVLVTCARIQQLGRGGADVWHDGLFHKRTETFERWVDSEKTKFYEQNVNGCSGLRVS